MGNNLLMIVMLPTIVFYQAQMPLLESEKVIQNYLNDSETSITFDMNNTGNSLIVSNEPIKTDNSGDEIISYSSDEKVEKPVHPKKKTTSNIPYEKKQGKKKLRFAVIEQAIIDLPINHQAPSEMEDELVRMLTKMSGAILYGEQERIAASGEQIIF